MGRIGTWRLTGLFLFTSIFLASFAMGQESRDPNSIHIATPSWEGQTNEDGTGFFFEIVRSIFEPEGFRLTYEFVPWKRAQQMVNSKQADAMLCVWQEHAKEEGQLIPNYPMFVEYTAAVFKKDAMSDWKGIESLNQKNAVWLRGYDYHTFDHLKDVKFKQWVEVDDYSLAWGMLEKDRIDVYIDALIDVDKYINAHKVDMTPYSVETLWGENAYTAFSNSERSIKMIEIYNRRIIEVFKSGELKKIYDKWNVKFSPDAWSQ